MPILVMQGSHFKNNCSNVSLKDTVDLLPYFKFGCFFLKTHTGNIIIERKESSQGKLSK